MGIGKYILVGHEPKEELDLHKWGKWFETADRHVAIDNLPNGVTISTIFLGLDHGFDDGPPLLFETMIFGGDGDQDQWRYATWEEAEKGHAKALELAKNIE